MTGINDRDWESLIDRIDLDVSDAELAAAEQRLQQLAPEDVAPVRAEWLDATVAKVRAEAAARDAAAAAPAPIHQLSLLRRLQRFAAAAAAVVGIHSFATAATVATVGVVAVTAAIVIWKAGVFSNETMSFRMAIEIQLRADQPDEDRSAAISQVYRRVLAAMRCMQRVRDSSSSTQTLSDGARSGLQALERQLNTGSDVQIQDVEDTFESSMRIAEDASTPEAVRLTHIRLLVDESAVGIAVILAMPNRSPRIEEDRAAVLRGLLSLASR